MAEVITNQCLLLCNYRSHQHPNLIKSGQANGWTIYFLEDTFYVQLIYNQEKNFTLTMNPNAKVVFPYSM